MVQLSDERDLETLRQISLLLDRENQRLITKNLQLTAELARLRGMPNSEQLALAALQDLQQARARVFERPEPGSNTSPAPTSRPPHPGHGPDASPNCRS